MGLKYIPLIHASFMAFGCIVVLVPRVRARFSCSFSFLLPRSYQNNTVATEVSLQQTTQHTTQTRLLPEEATGTTKARRQSESSNEGIGRK